MKYCQVLPKKFTSNEDAVFSKSDAWRYEREWRFALKQGFQDDVVAETGRSNQMEGVLEEIIVAPKIDTATLQAIRALRDAFCPNVPITKIEPVREKRGYIRKLGSS